MGAALKRIHEHRNACKTFELLSTQAANVLVIHYSCESFYDRPDGHSPRITSIAVRNFESGQTHSFSIHKIAELKQIVPDSINESYDKLEREMLDEFFDYVKRCQGFKWVHWNMRNINYGFQAVEHRYRVLGGNPEIIDDSKKYDISRLLVAKYGIGYCPHPRLGNIISRNKITTLDFMDGKQEADAFDSAEYVKLHQSTLRKVDILSNILGRASDNSLKTDARWYEIYGVTPQALGELIKEHWLISILIFFMTVFGFILTVVSAIK